MAIADDGGVRFVAGQHLPHRRAHRRQLWRIQRGFGVNGRVAGRQGEVVALPEGQFELLGKMDDHVAARNGAAGLHETEMPGGDLRLEGEFHLAQSAALAPLAQRRADGPPQLRCKRRLTLTPPPLVRDH